jgi:hypothetical protein
MTRYISIALGEIQLQKVLGKFKNTLRTGRIDLFTQVSTVLSIDTLNTSMHEYDLCIGTCLSILIHTY